jgi:glutamyl-tRNA synthetase
VHIGSLRTALFSYLLARHNGGVNILRVEDTDQNRLVTGALENLVEVLHKMGIEFDEGFYFDSASNKVAQRGNFGPYLQSERLEIYQSHVQKLLDMEAAYYCYCSSTRLEEIRKEQTALKKPPMYDRHCRTLTAEQREAELQACLADGRKPVVRMKIPTEGETVINDLIYGDIAYKHAVLDDQIILKQDGFPTYHLAVVVDDHRMEITHVIRGEEWLPSTPKHILLYKAFGWEPTAFAHLPLILNPDKSKLSKRQGDVAVEDFLKKGYLKEALVNFVALLGWNPKTEQEFFSLEELVAQFELPKVNKSGAVFDLAKLDWVNSHYIKTKEPAELAQLLVPYWTAADLLRVEPHGLIMPQLSNAHITEAYLESVAVLERERLKKLSDITESTAYFFSKPTYNTELLVWKKSSSEDALEKLKKIKSYIRSLDNATVASSNKLLESIMQGFIQANAFDVGSVMWPLRAALTGQRASPGPAEVLSVLYTGLGLDEILDRLDTAIAKLTQ